MPNMPGLQWKAGQDRSEKGGAGLGKDIFTRFTCSFYLTSDCFRDAVVCYVAIGQFQFHKEATHLSNKTKGDTCPRPVLKIGENNDLLAS